MTNFTLRPVEPGQRWDLMSGDRRVGKVFASRIDSTVTLHLNSVTFSVDPAGKPVEVAAEEVLLKLARAFGCAPEPEPEQAEPSPDPIIEEVKTEKAGVQS